ncbi:MAG TPA: M15 family metallopeptidase [Rhodanobacteraceae bacterium]
MPVVRLTSLAVLLAAAGAAPAAWAAAAPLCTATPPPESAAYVAHITEVNYGKLGIPRDYAAEHHLHIQPLARDLVRIPNDVYGRKQYMVAPAAAALKRMFAAAAHNGIKLEPVSAYRSIAYQTHLVQAKLNRHMTILQALKINAVPGYSEHQTGCAIDLTTPGYPGAETSFDKSKAFAWLKLNAATYGFHMPYPPGNGQGYEYEPWHWRYIAGSAPAPTAR